jgi:hypothetical protein
VIIIKIILGFVLFIGILALAVALIYGIAWIGEKIKLNIRGTKVEKVVKVINKIGSLIWNLFFILLVVATLLLVTYCFGDALL